MATTPTTDGDVVELARATLELRRSQLLNAIAEAAEVPASDDSNTIGETEHLSGYEQRAVDSARTSMLTIELEDVTDAIARLDAGTYGTCEGCGHEIAPERLEVVPAARSCVRCG